MQITAEVSKVTKSAQRNLTFTFTEISETANSFVKICLAAEIKKRFDKNTSIWKTRLHKNVKHVETFIASKPRATNR